MFGTEHFQSGIFREDKEYLHFQSTIIQGISYGVDLTHIRKRTVSA